MIGFVEVKVKFFLNVFCDSKETAMLLCHKTCISLQAIVLERFAHDYVPVLKQWLTSEGIKNSYDSWHGTYFKITILNTLLFLMTLYDLLLSQKLLQYRIFPLCLTQHFFFMQRW